CAHAGSPQRKPCGEGSASILGRKTPHSVQRTIVPVAFFSSRARARRSSARRAFPALTSRSTNSMTKTTTIQTMILPTLLLDDLARIEQSTGIERCLDPMHQFDFDLTFVAPELAAFQLADPMFRADAAMHRIDNVVDDPIRDRSIRHERLRVAALCGRQG